jgi:hypothetical protein
VILFDQRRWCRFWRCRHRARADATHVLFWSKRADGGGKLEPLASFMTNPAGSAIVNAFGPIRQIVQGEADTPVPPGHPTGLGDGSRGVEHRHRRWYVPPVGSRAAKDLGGAEPSETGVMAS